MKTYYRVAITQYKGNLKHCEPLVDIQAIALFEEPVGSTNITTSTLESISWFESQKEANEFAENALMTIVKLRGFLDEYSSEGISETVDKIDLEV